MTWWQSHSDFLAEMRPSAKRPDCSQPRLLSSTVLMPWPVLGGYRFTAGQAEYLKTGFKKKKIKQQLSGCRSKMPASPCAVGTQRKKGAFLWQL